MSGKHRDKPGQLLDFPPHLVTGRPQRVWGPGWRGLMNYSVSECPGLWLGYYCWWLSQQPLMQCVMQSWPLIGQVSQAPASDWLVTCCMMPGRFYPLRVMTGSGWDVPPDTWHVTHIVTLRRHTINGQWTGSCRERGPGCWPIRSQGWSLLTNQMRRVTVRHSRVKQGARGGQERTGAVAGAADAKRYPRFYLRTENTLDYCSAPDKEWQSFLGKKIELDWLMCPDCRRNGWQSHQTLSHYLTQTSEPSYVDISSGVRQDYLASTHDSQILSNTFF